MNVYLQYRDILLLYGSSSFPFPFLDLSFVFCLFSSCLLRLWFGMHILPTLPPCLLPLHIVSSPSEHNVLTIFHCIFISVSLPIYHALPNIPNTKHNEHIKASAHAMVRVRLRVELRLGIRPRPVLHQSCLDWCRCKTSQKISLVGLGLGLG